MAGLCRFAELARTSVAGIHPSVSIPSDAGVRVVRGVIGVAVVADRSDRQACRERPAQTAAPSPTAPAPSAAKAGDTDAASDNRTAEAAAEAGDTQAASHNRTAEATTETADATAKKVSGHYAIYYTLDKPPTGWMAPSSQAFPQMQANHGTNFNPGTIGNELRNNMGGGIGRLTPEQQVQRARQMRDQQTAPK